MKTFSLALFTSLFTGLFNLSSPAQNQKEIVGYYPNWQWYDRNQLVDPEAIFYEKYTVINYAFFRPLFDGGVISSTPLLDTIHALVNEVTSSYSTVDHALSVYPNPASGMVTINTTKPVLKVSVFSTEGELIKYYHRQQVIDTGQLKRGVYFLHILTETGLFYQKLVKI